MSPETLEHLMTAFTLLIGSGGLAGAAYALLRLRPEAGQITVDAAHKVVQFQAEVIDRIERRNIAIEKENEALRSEIAQLRNRIAELERRIG